MKEKLKNVILDFNSRIKGEKIKKELRNKKPALGTKEQLEIKERKMEGEDKVIIENKEEIRKPMEEKIHLMIDLCTDKNQLLKLRKILVEFESENLTNEEEKRKEIIKDDERKIKRK